MKKSKKKQADLIKKCIDELFDTETGENKSSELVSLLKTMILVQEFSYDNGIKEVEAVLRRSFPEYY